MTHMTLLTGPERRRRWSEDDRVRILAASFTPGAVVADVARQFEISTSLIYKWRKACLSPPAAATFAPAILVDAPEATPNRAQAQVPAILVELPGGARVNIASSAPTALVAATLKALRP
jgi:transposase